jgi:pyroglutamyl-peptidase
VILVLGFGSFADVPRNPSEWLAGALDGSRVGGHTVVGRSMPVSYQRSVDCTCRLAGELSPTMVLGIGLASERSGPQFEIQAVNAVAQDIPDVDGMIPAMLDSRGPNRRTAPFPAGLAAAAIGGKVSRDAGNYVCNAWLYGVIGRLAGVQVGFLHLPSEGISAARVMPSLLVGLGQGA